MWIDALCINQGDSDEKAKQIRLMSDIYIQAQRGLIWLGEESRSDQDAIRSLHALNDFISWYRREISRGTLRGQGTTVSFEIPAVQKKIAELKISPQVWGCLNQFFQRPWFSRVWIIQEAVFVANSEVPTLVACGNLDLSWADVANVAAGIVDLGLFFLYGSGYLQKLGHLAVCLMEELRQTPRDSPSRNILAMLNATRESKATDARDKVFALYGLLGNEEADSSLLLPDYTKDVTRVYTDVAIHILRRSRSLGLLQSIPWTLPQYGGSGGGFSLPSWVPDWSRRHAVPQLQSSMFHAGGRLRQEFRIHDAEKILVIKGMALDCLETLMDPDAILQGDQDKPGCAEARQEPLLQMEQILHHKRGWYKCCLSACWRLSHRSTTEEFPLPSIQDKYPTGESLQEAFWRTLICNMNMQGRRAGPEYRNHWLTVHQLYSRFEDVVSGNLELKQILDMMAFEEPMGTFAEGRRFCTTANGYMGWAPQQAQLGDLLCIFKGAEVPFPYQKSSFSTKRSTLPNPPWSRVFQDHRRMLYTWLNGRGVCRRAGY